MKLWVFSDLHLEIAPLKEPLKVPSADVCVVAGDVTNKGILPSIDWLVEHIGRHMPVVFVAGNHEFYKSFMSSNIAAASKIGSESGVHFLENSCVTIKDVVFCGATLWTDFGLFGLEWRELAMRRVKVAMNDYRLINLQKRPYLGLKPVHTYRKHIESLRFLERCLLHYQGKEIVVVTHHAPSIRSVESKYRDDIITTAFASNLDELIETMQPALWVHGHVHHHVDYVIGRTRVVANPKGYPGEASFRKFNTNWIIEV